jgi:periplasmic copper chaperone A
MRAARTVAGLGVAMLAGLVAAVGIGAGPASAHVTVNPREATQGGYAKLAFRVPNERDNASTVKVEVNIPAETAIASVSVRPTPGWTAAVERSKLTTPLKVHGEDVDEAITKITWTAAAGSEVKPGQFQEFEVSAGPLPEVDRIVFKALQTYSNNEVVRWIEEPPAAGVKSPSTRRRY